MSALGAAGFPSRLAGGQQVVLLRTVERLRGAQEAAQALTATDAGAEAAAPVPGATGHALGTDTEMGDYIAILPQHNGQRC